MSARVPEVVRWAVEDMDPPADFTLLWAVSFQLMREQMRRLDKLATTAADRYGIDRLRMVHGFMADGSRASWVECDSRRVTPMVTVRAEGLRVSVEEVE